MTIEEKIINFCAKVLVRASEMKEYKENFHKSTEGWKLGLATRDEIREKYGIKFYKNVAELRE